MERNKSSGTKTKRKQKKNEEEIKIYQRDEAGNIMYTEIDGVKTPIEIGTAAGYNKPVLLSKKSAENLTFQHLQGWAVIKQSTARRGIEPLIPP